MNRTRSVKREVFLFVLAFGIMLGAGAFGFYVYGRKTAEVHFSINGEERIELEVEDDYLEPGFKAEYCFLLKCEDITDKIIVDVNDLQNFESKRVGEYTLSYSLNYAGEKFDFSRTVVFSDHTAPVLTLLGDKNIGMRVGEGFFEPGFSAVDNEDGDITGSVQIFGEVDTGRSGVYKLEYLITDNSGNISRDSRNVFVYDWYAFETTPTATFDELANYVQANGWDISFGFYNFEKDYYYTFQGDKIYYGASLVKTLDAMYVYEFLDPSGYTGLVRNAITYSNNVAHITLVNQLGMNNLRNYAERIGMKHHLKGSVIYTDTGYFCDTTVEDQLAEWKHLWELINNNPRGTELRNFFINNFWDNLRFNGSPTHMYKNGLYSRNYHEVGIMFAESPYEVAILSTEGWRWNSTTIMKDLSHRIYMINEVLAKP